MPTTEQDVRDSISAELPDNLVKAIKPINIRNVYNKMADWVGEKITALQLAYDTFVATSNTNFTTLSTTLTTQYGNTAVVALTDGATIAWNVNNGNISTVTLGGNRTLAISNAVSGQHYKLIVKQDATGGRGLTLPSGSETPNGGAGTIALSTAPNAKDILNVFYVAGVYYINKDPNYS